MSRPLTEGPVDLTDTIEQLITEDDEPVDDLFSAKHRRLLVQPLYASWTLPPSEEAPHERRKFLADANSGGFYSPSQPPLVPNFFLSLDAEPLGA